jgi:hypothetical protein
MKRKLRMFRNIVWLITITLCVSGNASAGKHSRDRGQPFSLEETGFKAQSRVMSDDQVADQATRQSRDVPPIWIIPKSARLGRRLDDGRIPFLQRTRPMKTVYYQKYFRNDYSDGGVMLWQKAVIIVNSKHLRGSQDKIYPHTIS